MKPPIIDNEAQRVQTLREYAILDTLPERAFDDITLLASQICHAPVALISLIDDDRQWFKSKVGTDVAETPRDISFCAHAIAQPTITVVPNTCEDERFASNPLVVGEPKIRFYAGAPLIAVGGQALGTLCVVDFHPRTLTVEQERGLMALSRMVMAQLELRRSSTSLAQTLDARRQQGEELRRSNDKLQAVIQSAPLAVFEVDNAGVVMSWNTSAVEMFGWTEAEALGTFLPIVPMDRLYEFQERRQELARGIKFTEYETRRLRKDGTLIDVSISAAPLMDDSGAVIGAIAIVADITRQKQAGEDLRRINEKLQALIRDAPLAIFEISVGGVVESWNTAAMEMFGWTADEIIGAQTPIVPANRRNELHEGLRKLSLGRTVMGFETQRLRKDGSLVNVNISASPLLDGDGNAASALCIAADINLRKEAEAVLRRSQAELEARVRERTAELASANKALTEEIERHDLARRRLDLQYNTVRVLADAATAAEAAPKLLQYLCEGLGWELGEMWTFDPIIDSLHLAHSWSVTPTPTFNAAARDIMIGQGSGLPACAWRTEDVVWISNLVSDPSANAAEEEGGPQSGFALPLGGGTERLGAVALYSTHNQMVDDEQIAIATTVLRQFGLFVERKRARIALIEAEQKYRDIYEHAIEGIFQTTPDGRYLTVSPALVRMYGYESAEDLINNVSDIERNLYLLPNRRREFIEQMDASGVVKDFESQIVRKDGTVVWISENAHAVRNSHGRLLYYEGTVEDITDRKALEAERDRILAEAIERADKDSLTGLLNHRAFHIRLTEETERSDREPKATSPQPSPWKGEGELVSLHTLRPSKPDHERTHAHTPSGKESQPVLALALIDVDNFGFLNGAYGYAVGDEALRRIAAALRSCCRPGDVIARYGGDEFALLLPDISTKEIESLEDRLHAALSSIVFCPPGAGDAIPLTISTGVSVYRLDAVTQADFLDIAHSRLQRAKSGGADELDVEALCNQMSRSVEGFATLLALVSAVDNKDRYTRHHSEDVLTYSVQIAEELGLDESQKHTIRMAALLHDVGKIGVPDRILRKPGALTPAEFEAVQQHPQIGAIIVAAVPGLSSTLDAVRHHHERWDGKGYPFGLAGEQTPRIARLMAVADAYSAMTTNRPYRKGISPEKAQSILREGAGSQWDPVCVNAFLAVQSRLSAATSAPQHQFGIDKAAVSGK